MLAARAALHLDDSKNARRVLRQVWPLLEHTGALQIVLGEGNEVAHALLSVVPSPHSDSGTTADLERRLHRYLGSASAKHAEHVASRPIEPLSAREVEVLQRIAGGSGNSAIVEQLCISENTVKFHVKKYLRQARRE